MSFYYSKYYCIYVKKEFIIEPKIQYGLLGRNLEIEYKIKIWKDYSWLKEAGSTLKLMTMMSFSKERNINRVE